MEEEGQRGGEQQEKEKEEARSGAFNLLIKPNPQPHHRPTVSWSFAMTTLSSSSNASCSSCSDKQTGAERQRQIGRSGNQCSPGVEFAHEGVTACAASRNSAVTTDGIDLHLDAFTEGIDLVL